MTGTHSGTRDNRYTTMTGTHSGTRDNRYTTMNGTHSGTRDWDTLRLTTCDSGLLFLHASSVNCTREIIIIQIEHVVTKLLAVVDCELVFSFEC